MASIMTAERAMVTLHGSLLYFRNSFMADNQGAEDTLLTLTADIVAAHVSNNSVAVNDLPNLIQNVHSALSAISGHLPLPRPGRSPRRRSARRSSRTMSFASTVESGRRCSSGI